MAAGGKGALRARQADRPPRAGARSAAAAALRRGGAKSDRTVRAPWAWAGQPALWAAPRPLRRAPRSAAQHAQRQHARCGPSSWPLSATCPSGLAPLLLFFLSDAFPGKRQGASADKMQLKAATVLSHGSGESHKLDPIDRGHGAQHLYRQLGPSGKHRGHLVPDGLMQRCLRGHLQFAGCFLGVPSIMH